MQRQRRPVLRDANVGMHQLGPRPDMPSRNGLLRGAVLPHVPECLLAGGHPMHAGRNVDLHPAVLGLLRLVRPRFVPRRHNLPKRRLLMLRRLHRECEAV